MKMTTNFQIRLVFPHIHKRISKIKDNAENDNQLLEKFRI